MTIHVWGVAALVLGAALGPVVGWILNNRFGRKSMEAARKRADETARNARREAEKAKRASVLETKQETLAMRNKADNDLRSRRGQLQKREKDLKASVRAQQESESQLARDQEDLREKGRNHAEREPRDDEGCHHEGHRNGPSRFTPRGQHDVEGGGLTAQ